MSTLTAGPLSMLNRSASRKAAISAKLAELDRDQDGKISHEELRLAVEALVREETNNRMFRRLVLALALAVVLLVGAVAGSVYGVVTLTQELKVRWGRCTGLPRT
jgi:CHASE3 domain sensor protein